MTKSSKDGQPASTQGISSLRLLISRHYISGRLGTYGIWIAINLIKLVGFMVVARLFDSEQFVLYSICFLAQDLGVLAINNSSLIFMMNKKQNLLPRQLWATVFISENLLAIIAGIIVIAVALFLYNPLPTISLVVVLVLATLARLNVTLLSRVCIVFTSLRTNLIFDLLGNSVWLLLAILWLLVFDHVTMEMIIATQALVGCAFLMVIYQRALPRLYMIYKKLDIWHQARVFYSRLRKVVVYAVLMTGFFSIEKLAVTSIFSDNIRALGAYLLISKLIFFLFHLGIGSVFAGTMRVVRLNRSGNRLLPGFYLRLAIIISFTFCNIIGYYFLGFLLVNWFPNQMSPEFLAFGYWVLLYTGAYQIIFASVIYFESVFKSRLLYAIVFALYVGCGFAFLLSADLTGYLQILTASIFFVAFAATIAFVKFEPEISNAKKKLSV